MAYDLELAERLRELVAAVDGITEQKMFGGLGFLVNGNMAVAASSEGGLMVRADPEAGRRWIDDGQARPMVMRGREMAGWLRVDATADDETGELARWVTRGVDYARSLPPKKAGQRR